MGYPARLARFAAIERAAGDEPDAILRLAAFAVLTVEDADRMRTRLRLSNDEHARLARSARTLAALHGAETPPPVSHLREMLFVCGARAAIDGLALAFAASGAPPHDSAWIAALHYLRTTPAPVFPLKGADLIARGMVPGRDLGAMLNALQKSWIRAGFPTEPAALQQLIERARGGAETV
jgi:poly(A) polymerase